MIHLWTGLDSITASVLLLALIAVLGLGVAGFKFRGAGLGISGVLFAGLIIGHLGLRIDDAVLSFVRDFGLILFVYTIGLQLGPSFFSSFRKEGFKLNILAVALVALGTTLTVLVMKYLPVPKTAAIGLFCGATTNTPSLGAAQETMKTLSSLPASLSALTALSFAVAYPMGVVGVIGAIVFLKWVCRVDWNREVELYRTEQRSGKAPLTRKNILIQKSDLDGRSLRDISKLKDLGLVVSRIQRAGSEEVEVATEYTIIRVGDIILAVGTDESLDGFIQFAGKPAEIDLMTTRGTVTYSRIVLTHKEVIGKTVRDLGLEPLFGVTVTRVTRADLEMTAVPDLRLQFGDMLNVVGEEAGLNKAADLLGNSFKALNHTDFMPFFLGILLGVIVGAVPIYFPSMPVPLKLGLAGGPLLVAIVLSRIGKIGPFLWYMPQNANLAFREIGIVLFLACVGLKAGENFFRTVLTHDGLLWLFVSLVLCVLPMIVVGWVARKLMKINFVTIAGLLSGSSTAPPALAFANSLSKSDTSSVAYATVYPLTMFLRILVAQLLVILFCR